MLNRIRMGAFLLLPIVLIACSGANDNVIAPAEPDSESYNIGQTVYTSYCAACHGAQGQGQFPDAPMQPDDTGRIGAPPHNETGHTWHHEDELLIQIIREGGMGSPEMFYPMPPFGEILSDEQITAVIAYIKTLWTDEQVESQRARTITIRNAEN